MEVDPATAKFSARHDGQDRYFHSKSCHSRFTADPARFYILIRPEAQVTN